MTKKSKDGQPIKFKVRDGETKRIICTADGKPLETIAFTAKAARHQAKQMFRSPVLLEVA